MINVRIGIFDIEIITRIYIPIRFPEESSGTCVVITPWSALFISGSTTRG
jgi:hypothetical protein